MASLAFFEAVGGDPKGLAMAIVNDEAGHCDFGKIKGNIVYDNATDECDYFDMSCLVLNAYDDTFISKVKIKQLFFSRNLSKNDLEIKTQKFQTFLNIF